MEANSPSSQDTMAPSPTPTADMAPKPSEEPSGSQTTQRALDPSAAASDSAPPAEPASEEVGVTMPESSRASAAVDPFQLLRVFVALLVYAALGTC